MIFFAISVPLGKHDRAPAPLLIYRGQDLTSVLQTDADPDAPYNYRYYNIEKRKREAFFSIFRKKFPKKVEEIGRISSGFVRHSLLTVYAALEAGVSESRN